MSENQDPTITPSELSKLTGKDGYGHVYIISFINSMIKVGMTTNPKQRIAHHKSTLGKVAGISSIWVSSKHKNYADNEKKLIVELGCGSQKVPV